MQRSELQQQQRQPCQAPHGRRRLAAGARHWSRRSGSGAPTPTLRALPCRAAPLEQYPGWQDHSKQLLQPWRSDRTCALGAQCAPPQQQQPVPAASAPRSFHPTPHRRRAAVAVRSIRSVPGSSSWDDGSGGDSEAEGGGAAARAGRAAWDLAKKAAAVAGLVGSLVAYGVLQERIMTLPFGTGDGREVFRYSLFLVSCNRAVAVIVAAATLAAKGMYSELRPVAPLLSYATVSLSNVVASTCQYEALKYVSFSVQTLGKCAKMFPVMLWGAVMLRKRYSWRDAALAVAITGGCFAFFVLGPTASRVARGPDSGAVGLLLMGAYLLADGFTSTFQQRLFAGYSMSHYNQVLYVGLCSIALSSFGLVSSGQLGGTLRFLSDHPEAGLSILALSMAATCGSLCINYIIKTAGALTLATVMTTRQMVSIVLSSIVFRSALTPAQWASAAVVVTALYIRGFAGKGRGGKGGGGKQD